MISLEFDQSILLLEYSRQHSRHRVLLSFIPSDERDRILSRTTGSSQRTLG